MNDSDRVLTTAQAVNEALKIAGQQRNDVLLFAEGVTDPSAVYGTTAGLEKVYPANRLIEMPIAENGLCGIAIGAAMFGKRPVVSFHRVEFALLALEQIINNAAKMYYGSNGLHTAPIVIRMVIGRGWGQGPQHSQSLESLFSCIPGLKVLMPVFPADAKGMLLAAIEDNSPTIIIEHRWCHYVKGNVPGGYFKADIAKPKKLKDGHDLTLVATSFSTLEALSAGEALRAIGVQSDLFDLRVLNPLNLDEIFESFEKTGRIITVDTGHISHGIGGEVVSQVIEKKGQCMISNPVRIGLPDHPVPSSRGYIPDLYPDTKKIVIAACESLGLSDEKTSQALSHVEDRRGNLPVDIPDPAFTGPF